MTFIATDPPKENPFLLTQMWHGFLNTFATNNKVGYLNSNLVREHMRVEKAALPKATPIRLMMHQYLGEGAIVVSMMIYALSVLSIIAVSMGLGELSLLTQICIAVFAACLLFVMQYEGRILASRGYMLRENVKMHGRATWQKVTWKDDPDSAKYPAAVQKMAARLQAAGHDVGSLRVTKLFQDKILVDPILSTVQRYGPFGVFSKTQHHIIWVDDEVKYTV